MVKVDLRLGDCLEILPMLPAGSVDAVITDPPYSLASASSRRSADKAMGWADINNASAWFSLWYSEVWRTLKSDGAFWTFCSWHSLPVVQCAMSRVPGMYMTSVVVWDKQWPGVGSTKGLRQNYEMIALAGKQDFQISDRSVSDIWPCKWASGRPNGHPAEKPIDLPAKIIEITELSENATILDPFMGSGTTGVACVQLNRNFIGIEIDPTYYAIAEKRIREAQMQISMELGA